MKTGLLWFRNDLRLSDNLALRGALAQCEEIVPIYVFDEQWLTEDRYGFDRTGPHRLRFLLESVADLQTHLRELGSDLVVKKGRPAEILPALAEQYGAEGVFATKAYTYEELQVEKKLAARLPVSFFHNTPLLHPDDVLFPVSKTPEVFTTFRKKVEKYTEVREPFLSPKKISSPALQDTEIPAYDSFGLPQPEADPRAVLPFRGGAEAAFDRMEHYFWETECLSEYKETRNGLIGADYSSKFSPWLAHGCISARSIYHEVEKYEAEVEKNKSTYWLKFELLWRDFFLYTAMRYGHRIFLPEGIKGKVRKWQYRPRVVQKWMDGETGDRFVDANMIELKKTGFMSNRGRQNVASYLVHKLGQDWRAGAAWFESQLIDYDVTSNYGNWMYAAGVGNDPRDRVFNTQRQAKMYDADGEYRDLWLQEQSADS